MGWYQLSDNRTVLAQIGANLRSLRIDRGWSQEELARRCGLDRTYVGGIERGERNVAIVNIARLATALGTGAEAIVRGIPTRASRD